jgi:uncharacterized cupredoxin-like copper-binding protein
MRRLLGVTAISTVALAALVGGLLAGTGHAVPGKASATVTKITVTETEWKIKLSKSTLPKTGTVAFKVVNKGKIGHDFKIAGKKTKLLNPGQSQTITVKFGKKGHFAYICSVKGHAALGMKGTFNVAAKPVSTSTTTTTGGGSTSTTTSVSGPATTINVSMKEYSFTLSQNSVPQGTVTFVIKNDGIEPHNFDISGIKAGAIIGPGQTETWTVGLAAKASGYVYVCDVPFHLDRGMTGTLIVT